MVRYLIFLFLTFIITQYVTGQKHTISGKILNNRNKKPIEFAVITLPDYELWTVADKKGAFTLDDIPTGRTTIIVSNLGYVRQAFDISVLHDTLNLKFHLFENNLALNEVVISAQRKADDATTTYILNRTALDHLQMISVSDITSLLPGGQTNRSNNLISAQQFALRSGATNELGNASFGTAVEIDGVRLPNNSSFGDNPFSNASSKPKGIDIRNIASSNIESIEVVNGVPSVEHGDLTNGMVKINTRKGESPITAEIIVQPNTKLFSVSKGFLLGKKSGILNTSIERTKSVSDIASPYTSYDRNTASLTYSNTLNRARKQPLSLTAQITGNIGGYNSKSDPDLYANTYEKRKDNTVRANIALNWSLNRSWLSNIEASSSVNYIDKLSKKNSYVSSASLTPAIHGTENGYFDTYNYDKNPVAPITLVPPGSWYRLAFNDSKQITYTTKVKANWARKFGTVNNKVMIGADFSRSGNNGRGTYYDDLGKAPDWREYRYKDIPFTNNIAIYAQEKINIPIQRTNLQLTAGVRSEIIAIGQSEYGTVNSLSPRFNMKYVIPFRKNDFLRHITIRAGYGKAVKLPSSLVLYPTPSYIDKQVFAPGEFADGSVYYAYNIQRRQLIYNSNLKWQTDKLNEVGIDINMKSGIKVSLSFFNTKTINPYKETKLYDPISYNLTNRDAINNILIPSANRDFAIDRNTGIITISDKTGMYPSEQLAYSERVSFESKSTYTNGSPLIRRGLEWIVDFGKISTLNTSIRFDGKYYYYKGLNENIEEHRPASSISADGTYKYIGYYIGSGSSSNGSIVKRLNTNLTITTHIPQIRLLVSLRIEGSLYNYSQELSEYKGGERSFVLDTRDATEPSVTSSNIYAGNQFVGMYPLYYATSDDPYTKIPFREAFESAKINNPALYNDLRKMVIRTYYDFIFNENKVSAYFSANIAVTKEIGKHVSFTFNAKNFFNNMSLVKSSQTDTKGTLYKSNRIPDFYYGITLKVKI